tara:strand:+ start:143 stop:937 length:795 start_codon:yes stop_codon:yes gene_type:complete
MANLKDLLYGYGEATSIVPQEFVLENTNHWLPQNGGCAYTWNVPAGKTAALFEVWSGGGGGAGSSCCMQGKGGQAGGYMKFYVPITSGDTICMCSGGTSPANASNICGFCGCHSTICKNGSWCICVTGGHCHDRNICFLGIQCYSCCASCYCCGGMTYQSGAPVVLHEHYPSASVHQATQWCYDASYQYMTQAYGYSGFRHQGTSTCCQSCHGGICYTYTSCCGQACYNSAHHPGSGGMTAWTHGNECRCGAPGAGGMIYVQYW